MEVRFTPELQTKIDRLAAENSSASDEYVRQRLGRGEFLSHEEVWAV